MRFESAEGASFPAAKSNEPIAIGSAGVVMVQMIENPANTIAIRRARRINSTPDFAPEFPGRMFVRIQRKDPSAARLFKRELLLCDITLELALENARAKPARDRDRAIGREGIDHDHLVAEGRGTLQALADQLFLIARDNDQRNLGDVASGGHWVT